MRNFGGKLRLVSLPLLLLAIGSVTIAQEPPANVAGDWTIHSTGPDGRSRTQIMRISQQGGVITGYYEGPGQVGDLEGTVNQQHIVFRTKTLTVLTFRGRVDGPRTDRTVQGRTISGTYRDKNGEGRWNAVRSE